MSKKNKIIPKNVATLIGSFLLVLAVWRFHSIVNGAIDWACLKAGIINPNAINIISFVFLLVLILVFFSIAGISTKKIWKELTGR